MNGSATCHSAPLSRPPLDRMRLILAAVRQGMFPNATDLARVLEVSTKSIHRDIEFLRDRLGFEIVYNPERHGYQSSGGCCPFCSASAEMVCMAGLRPKPEPQSLIERDIPKRESRFNEFGFAQRDQRLKAARKVRNRRREAKRYHEDVADGTRIQYPKFSRNEL